jgi:hypothetical protein
MKEMRWPVLPKNIWKKVNLKECDLYNNRAGMNLRRSEIERRIRLGKSDRHYPWSVLVVSTHFTLDERYYWQNSTPSTWALHSILAVWPALHTGSRMTGPCIYWSVEVNTTLDCLDLPVIGRTCIDWFTNDDLVQRDPGVGVHLHDRSRRPIRPRVEDQGLNSEHDSTFFWVVLTWQSS